MQPRDLDYIHYREFVRTLATPTGEVLHNLTEDYAATAGTNINLLHAAIGLCTEVGELAEGCMLAITGGIDDGAFHENFKEELGDILFYFQLLLVDFGLNIHDIRTDSPDMVKKAYALVTLVDDKGVSNAVAMYVSLTGMSVSVANIVDFVKRAVFYNKPVVVEDLLPLCRDFAFWYASQVAAGGFMIDDIEQANRKKLEKRYHGLTFNSEHALQRADKQETPDA